MKHETVNKMGPDRQAGLPRTVTSVMSYRLFCGCQGPFHRRRRRRIPLSGNPSGQECKTAGLDRVGHGAGHSDRVCRARNPRVEQHTIGTQLHGNGHIGSRPHTCVHDDRVVRIPIFQVFEAQLDVGWVENALTAPDRRSKRHDARRPGVFESLAENRVVRAIRQNVQVVLGEGFRGLQRADRVGQQRFLVRQYFELNPFRAGVAKSVEQFAA